MMICDCGGSMSIFPGFSHSVLFDLSLCWWYLANAGQCHYDVMRFLSVLTFLFALSWCWCYLANAGQCHYDVMRVQKQGAAQYHGQP